MSRRHDWAGIAEAAAWLSLAIPVLAILLLTLARAYSLL